MAFRGGLSFNLDAVIIPDAKEKLVQEGYERSDAIMEDYNMGLITNNERYNQIIDVWTNINTKLTKVVIDTLIKDDDGFNPVYMMLDSGARGSKEQIRQLSGMRGLMAKPQKSGVEGGQQVIENPILSNFKEGLSVLEYFISTHGARKGLADTALKTADAGYLTRRLVDVAQDVIINEEDCGTLRGLTATAIKRNDDVVQTLYDRILGRIGTERRDPSAYGRSDLQGRRGDHRVDRRSDREVAAGVGRDPLGADLRGAPRRMRQVLRPQPCHCPHGAEGRSGRRDRRSVDRRAGYAAYAPYVPRRRCGRRLRPSRPMSFRNTKAVWKSTSCAPSRARTPWARRLTSLSRVSRSSASSIPKTEIVLYTHNLPYGATLFMADGAEVKKGDLICEWDPYNAVIISEYEGQRRLRKHHRGRYLPR